MAGGLIESIKYPQVQAWYNSDLNRQMGNMDYIKNGDAYIQFNEMISLHLNASGTSEQNPKTDTLFTFANGVKIQYTYYNAGQDETTVYIEGYVKYVDINDNVLYSNILSMGSDLDYASASDFPIWFNPARTSYEDRPAPGYGDNASRLYYWDVYYLRQTLPPGRTPMTLDGDIRTYDSGIHIGWSTYYRQAGNWWSTEEEYQDFLDTLNGGGDGTPINPILPSDDTSGPGGGDDNRPDYNPFSDPVDFPDLPSGGAIESGMVHVYSPTSGQLRGLAQKLWSTDFYDTIIKILADPMEAIISLHTIPFSVPGSSTNCMIGNYNTEIAMPAVTQQYYSKDMGSIYIPEHWASALDYGPYTSVDIYLPFIGIRPVLVDDIVGKTLSIRYNIDIITGSAVCFIKVGGSVLYVFNTTVSSGIPLTMSSYEPLVQSLKGAIGAMAVAGSTGGVGGAIGAVIGSGINVATSKASTVSRGSTIGSTHGFLSDYRPYLIIHRPIQSLASGFSHFKGYPSNITGTIGSVSGYTEVESVHLTGIPCTDAERDEIMALLYNGVIV